ncbi:cellulose binding domain-containing protein [Saccharothrix deserti]|uniref:cellulose binding domain-containing protein n=1 Tax=Saccharothrix deserti TaxID=2593674 RepID=UPI00131B06BF|nr:cellulose binding domain-containing protein [Saccharothrix deserti]
MCSDVRFPGGASDPTTPQPDPPAPNDGCSATYTLAGQWAGGFQADVKVTAAPTAIRGWTVKLRFPDGQTVGQSWYTSITSDGTTTTARNVDYNGTLAAGAGTTLGIQGNWLGTNGPPTLSCAATR